MEVEELMKYMLNLFNNIDKQLHEEYEKLSQKDMELSDLDHYIENHKLRAYEYAKVGKLRQTLRGERRSIKNNIEMIETIKKFTDKYNNKLITGDIIQNLKEQGLLKNKQENPSYKYRTNILERLETRDEQGNK
jgi:hypothetical protein